MPSTPLHVCTERGKEKEEGRKGGEWLNFPPAFLLIIFVGVIAVLVHSLDAFTCPFSLSLSLPSFILSSRLPLTVFLCLVKRLALS